MNKTEFASTLLQLTRTTENGAKIAISIIASYLDYLKQHESSQAQAPDARQESD